MNTARALDVLCIEAPALIAAAVRAGSRCIFATRVGVEVLGACGIEAEPLAVQAAVLNAAGYRWERSNRAGDPAALGVRSIVVGPESTGPGWSGHLLVRVRAADLAGGWALADLDLRQFVRPPAERDGVTFGAIELPRAAWFPTDTPAGPWAWSYGDPEAGPLVAYQGLQDATWRRSSDWRGAWSGELRRAVGGLVRAVRAAGTGPVSR